MVRRSVMARTKEATELDRQIGMRLRLLRVTRDKTQEWLAEQLGLTFQQVQKTPRGGSCSRFPDSQMGLA
jgi:hypothetical protein